VQGGETKKKASRVPAGTTGKEKLKKSVKRKTCLRVETGSEETVGCAKRKSRPSLHYLH